MYSKYTWYRRIYNGKSLAKPNKNAYVKKLSREPLHILEFNTHKNTLIY